MAELNEYLSKAEESMEEATMYLEEALARVRAGKANAQ